MPKFIYKAKEGPHKIVDGTIEAENVDSAIAKISMLGLFPVDVNLVNSVVDKKSVDKKTKGSFHLFKRVRSHDVVIFTRQMSDLVDAFVPILRSLQIVSQQTSNLYFRNMVDHMCIVVRDGVSFSDSLAQHSEVFSLMYINMVKTGEVSGQLELVLKRLADYLEKEQDTHNKVRASLAYPIFILVIGIITVFILFSFIIPRLTVMFEDLDQSLPLPTLILMNISGFFARFWWLMIGMLSLGGYYFRQWLQSDHGRIWMDSTKLKIPLLGEFIRVVEIGRFARTLGTLVESGVIITTALKAVYATIENSILREEIRQVAEAVESGSSLKVALRKCKFFPEVAINMISVGEETGHLERGLFKTADNFERQSDETVKTVLSLLGPVVLVFIVSFVGFIVIAMLLPIFKMNLLIQ